MALIHLVRHGRSALRHDGSRVDVPAFRRFCAAYDVAGIDGEAPDAELVARCAGADRIIASDLRRAVESAERLAAGRPIETSPLLREAPLALPDVPLPLPMDAWDAIYHAMWSARAATGIDSEGVLARASAAADWLLSKANGSGPLVVITHGTFRRLTGRELARRGARQTAGGFDYRNWSAWIFTPGPA